MSPVVAAGIGAAVAAAVGATGAAAIAIAVAVNIAVSVAASMAIGAISKALMGSPRQSSRQATGPQSRMLTVREAAAPRQMIYGRSRVGGVLTFIHTTSDGARVHGYLHMVITLSGHPIESIEDVILNDEVIPLDGSGNVTSGRYAGHVVVKKGLGTTAGDADLHSFLQSQTPLWTTNHRQDGCAKLYVRLKFNNDVFPTGIPNITAVVKGAKVYDPRTDTTVWSANPALCVADYLRSPLGFNVAQSRIAWDTVTAAANLCDENVTLAGGGTEKRYTCNGAFNVGEERQRILEHLLGSMAGDLLSPVGSGKWRLFAGAHRTPTRTITATDLDGPIRVQARVPRSDIFNSVKGLYAEPSHLWQPTDFPVVSAASYVTEDGGEPLWHDIRLDFTTSHATAQRLAKIELQRVRRQITVTIPCNLRVFGVQTADVVRFTYERFGWIDKEFLVAGWQFAVREGQGGPTLGIDLVLRETDANVWAWSSTEEEPPPPASQTDLPNPFVGVAPTNLTLASGAGAGTDVLFTAPDGTTVPRILATWTAPADGFADSGRIEIQRKRTADGADAWAPAGETAGTQTRALIDGVRAGTAYDVRIRAINSLGVKSAWVTATNHTVIGDDGAPSAPTGLVASVGTGKLVELRWAANTEADLDEYQVFRHTTNNSGTATLIAETRTTKFVDTNVTLGTQYFYWVKAVDRSENVSGFSSGVSATPSTVLVAEVDATAPATPAAPTFSADGTYQASDGTTLAFITVNVPAMPSGGRWLNLLYRRSGAPNWEIATQRSSGGGTERVDDLTPGVQYQFAAQAFSFSAVASAISSTLSRTAPGDTTAPSAPTAITLRQNGSRSVEIDVAFTAPEDWGTTRLYRGTTNSFGAATLIDQGKKARFHDQNVAHGATYYYWATVVDVSGNASGASPSTNHSIQIHETPTIVPLGLAGDINIDVTGAIQAALDDAALVARGSTTRNVVTVELPDGDHRIEAQIVVPPRVNFRCNGVLYNFLADAWEPAIHFQPGSHCEKLQLWGNLGSGVLFGAVGEACNMQIGDVRLWNIGEEFDAVKGGKIGVKFHGFNFTVESIDCDGGNVGIDFDLASDVRCDKILSFTASTGLRITSACEHLYLNKVVIDTPDFIGMQIDSSHDIHINAEVFLNDNEATGAITRAVKIGEFSAADKVNNLHLTLRVQNTGGIAVSLWNILDSLIDLIATNAPLATGNTYDITTAVEYNTGVEDSLLVRGVVGDGITAISGTPVGSVHLTNAGALVNASTNLKLLRDQNAAATTALALINKNTTDGSGIQLNFQTTTTGAGGDTEHTLAQIRGLFVTHDHATRRGDLIFLTASAGGAAERLRITGAGNVVIGTSQPTTDAQPLTITQAGSASWVSVKLELATSQIGYGIYSSHTSWTNPFSTAAADGYDGAVFDSKFISTITWWSPTSGGLALIGNSSGMATPAINFSGSKGSASPIVAVFQFNGVKSDGSGGRSPLSGSEMLFRVRNDGSDVLTIRGNGGVSFTSPGPHSIGGSLDPLRQLVLHGTFAERQALRIATRVQPPAGISSHLLIVAGTIDKAGSGTHAIFAGAQIDAPTITAGAATVTDAITLRVSGAPTGGVNNYALQVDAGVSRFGGTVDIDTTTGALLVPRMTTTQRNALTAANGMIIYNTTDNQLQGRVNGAWVAL